MKKKLKRGLFSLFVALTISIIYYCIVACCEKKKQRGLSALLHFIALFSFKHVCFLQPTLDNLSHFLLNS